MNAASVREMLFPTDFSAVSAAAGRTAADFARHFGARLHVLHVVPAGFSLDGPRAALEEMVAGLGGDVTLTRQVERGLAAPAIVAYAQAHRIDLIVMGTHGRTGFSHVLLGSVAEAVVRRAPCAVLTVPLVPVPATAPAQALPPAAGRCIVCARSSPDLICDSCRARIRGEALGHKWNEERAVHTAGR